MYKNACNWLMHSTEPKNNWSLRHYEKSLAFQLAENTSGQLVGNINTAPEWENSMAILNNRQEVIQRPAEMSHLLATVAVKPPLEQQ